MKKINPQAVLGRGSQQLPQQPTAERETSLQINISSEEDSKAVVQHLQAIKSAFDAAKAQGISSVEFVVQMEVEKKTLDRLLSAIRWCRTYVRRVKVIEGNVFFELPHYRNGLLHSKGFAVIGTPTAEQISERQVLSEPEPTAVSPRESFAPGLPIKRGPGRPRKTERPDPLGKPAHVSSILARGVESQVAIEISTPGKTAQPVPAPKSGA